MRNTDFYHQVLGLNDSWKVSDVHLDLEKKKVEVRVEFSGKANCPECGKACAIHDHAAERRWRHLDTCDLRTMLIARVPRTSCEEHGVKTISIPWAAPHGRFTMLFEQVVIDWLLVTRSQTGVAKQLRLSFDQVHSIMTRAVERGLARRSELPVKYLGIDEKSMKRGHNYMTVVSDLSTGRVLEVTEKRTQESAEKAIQAAVCEDLRPEVKAVCTDMWPAFMSATAKVLPEAKLVHDRFHIAKHLNDAVDKTRREEQRKLLAKGDDRVKRARYMFLTNFADLDEDRLVRFAEARAAAAKTTAVWESKETFRAFWSQPTVAAARTFLENWCANAIEKSVAALNSVASMIATHAEGLTNFMEHRITNSIAENLNGKIQHLKASARGFWSFENYRTNILFYHGHLDLNPRRIP
jgi:transposase